MILTLGTTPAIQRVMTFERLSIDAVNRAVGVEEGPAGKAINVAKVAAEMGGNVLALSFAGGATGKRLGGYVEQLGIQTLLVPVAPPTRTCVTLIDREAGTTTELVEESTAVEPQNYDELLAALKDHIARGRVLVMSGTLTPGGPSDFYARCVSCASAAGVMSIVDAKGEALLKAVEARPMLVKPNLGELSATLGRPVRNERDLVAAAHELCRRGAAWTLVTRGAAPAVLCNGREAWTFQVPQVRAINPIGSGDALAGGVAVALARGDGTVQACRLGIACGAANAMTLLAGQVRRSDVEALVAQVQVQAVPQ